ncbi:hypothetical protein [Neolewinella xylanilytica]|uniref:hypothetical protein n=1 Tax=Neolewinella xylanilytica TaxID=1514080 RepID=UPI000CEAE98F|nr:hypothetical protein [Neolewinella xylanilytica]
MAKKYVVSCSVEGDIGQYDTDGEAALAAKAHKQENGSEHKTSWTPAGIFSIPIEIANLFIKGLRYPNFAALDAVKSNIQIESEEDYEESIYYVFCKTHGFRDIFLTFKEAEAAKEQHERQCLTTCDWAIEVGSLTDDLPAGPVD